MQHFDRVALVGFCWFALWTSVGTALGRWLQLPGSCTIAGFFFALVTIFAWPWVLPDFVWTWMDE